MRGGLPCPNNTDAKMEKYRIVTLAENCVYGKGLRAEHGLSVYVETPAWRVLFDTGASGLFALNARRLGIDLGRVDCLVLSHGHADHTGGLAHFLELNKTATVVCRHSILEPKFKNGRENGLLRAGELDLDRFRFVTEPVSRLFPDADVVSCPDIRFPADTHFDRFFRLTPDGRSVPDTFDDESALVLHGEGCVSVLSACSHRGITNVLEAVRAAYPGCSLHLLLGGFHIHTASVDKCDFIADYLTRFPPRRLGVCHCTGVDAYARLRARLGDRVFYNSTGTELRFPEA